MCCDQLHIVEHHILRAYPGNIYIYIGIMPFRDIYMLIKIRLYLVPGMEYQVPYFIVRHDL